MSVPTFTAAKEKVFCGVDRQYGLRVTQRGVGMDERHQPRRRATRYLAYHPSETDRSEHVTRIQSQTNVQPHNYPSFFSLVRPGC